MSAMKEEYHEEITLAQRLAKIQEEKKKLEKEMEDQIWSSTIKQTMDRLNKLRGIDLVRFYRKGSFYVFRITEVAKSHDVTSGFYGQWDERRWLVATGIGYSVSIGEAPLAYELSDLLSGKMQQATKISMRSGAIAYGELGIPLKPRAKKDAALRRFLEMGEIQQQSVEFEIGRKAYEERDHAAFGKAWQSFLTFLRLAPEGLLEACHEHFVHRLKHDLKAIEKINGLLETDFKSVNDYLNEQE